MNPRNDQDPRTETGPAPFMARVVIATIAVGAAFVLLGPGCAQDPAYDMHPDAGTGGAGIGTGGGAGGMAATGGTAGRGDYAAPACDPTKSTLGKITVASPIVPTKKVLASAGVMTPEKVVDGVYAHAGLSVLGAMLPAWVAIELEPGPTRLLLSWADVGWENYNAPISGGSPADYSIATSADSTNGADGTWDVVASVTDNPVRERAHTFAFGGKRWVRMSMTKAASASRPIPGIFIDEIAIHDISQTASGAPPDTWFFMGDSITAGAFQRQHGRGTSFDEIIHAARPDYFPNMMNGGIGGETSGSGATHIVDWLALNPAAQHIALLYGTNDSWGDRLPPPTMYEDRMRTIVRAVLDAGRTPILARIPYSVVAPTTLPQFNAIVDKITTDNGLPCGPDLYAWFRDHPEEMTADGVHPNPIGYQSINRLWANAMLGLYPAN